MSALLSCDSITKSFGTRVLFEDVCLQIHQKERVGLIGPNGAGKSTFLKILIGLVECDHGSVIIRNNIRLAYIPQIEAINPNLSVFQAVLEASQSDPEEDYQKEAQAIVVLGKMRFDDIDMLVRELSGGWLKRLSIARQLAREPDIILLDEPTNHLDIDGIEWLENFLKTAQFAFILITHDRVFLNSATNRIIELNEIFDAGMLSFNCAYTEFMSRRTEFLEAERSRYESLANKSRHEQKWVKAGVKARGTKSRSRLEEAGNLLRDVKKLKKQTTAPSKILIKFDQTDRKTKRLAVLHNISKKFGDKQIIQDLDLILTPGVRIGLMGANGVGKTTLMKLISGEEQVDAGGVNIAEGAKILHFDQKRQLVDEEQTLKEALSLSGGDTVIYRGNPMHISAWARKLKFRGEQLMSPIKSLSGGERARVIIGRLMLQPADILLLDEPTNDLDIPSIEVLEESLMEFPGAIVLITHDRALLDRLSTIILALDGKGHIMPYASYQQWKQAQKSEGRLAKSVEKSTPKQKTKPSKKLTYKDQRELNRMEQTIQEAEQNFESLQNNPVDHDAGQAFLNYCDGLSLAEQKIETLYARWAELEEKRAILTKDE